ncbi:MAG: hypothetical protein JW750_02375 [Anaerolineaceae bacterium]|nr:hypothetical protein [Anaerolineaceae bacterium]
MPIIQTIQWRKILNSHVDFTTEFIVELDDGTPGVGASPQGETISIYEDRKLSICPADIIQQIKSAGLLNREITQEEFDTYLETHIAAFGRNNAYGLSLAFFNARAACNSIFDAFGVDKSPLVAPHLCCNILNGGLHAYTNPILSDFPEYILVARSNNIKEVIAEHNEIQRVVREKLYNQQKTLVAGNVVSCFKTRDNRECIDFLLNITHQLGFQNHFDLMIDASGTDLLNQDGYHLPVTDQSEYSKDAFLTYWLEIIENYDLHFLEDPFHEQDVENWQLLTKSQDRAKVIGDNFYTSDAERIQTGSEHQYTHGVLIKPNQAGTVSAVRKAICTAQENGQIAITSHRSISTESTFLASLTCIHGVNFIKIGPLQTDYSSIVRLNQILRLTEG